MCGLKYAKKETNTVISNTECRDFKNGIHEAGIHSPPKSTLAEILPVIL